MAQLLVVHHSPSTGVARLTRALLAGARCPEIEGVEVRDLPALAFARDEAGAADLLAADGYLLLTPANFGAMSGALKHVFDSTFLAIGGALGSDGAPSAGADTRGRPYGLLVHGRYDTAGAVRGVEAIVGALAWRPVASPVQVLGDVTPADEDAAYELGATCAALLT